MKIGVDIRTLSEGKMTGVEVYALNLLRHLFLIDKTNNYKLFTNSFHLQQKNFTDFSNLPNVEIKSYGFPNRLLNSSFKILNYPKIDKLLGGVDVFFTPRYLFQSLSKNCPLIITVHDLSFIRDKKFFSIKQRLWHWLVSDKNACEKAKKIITVSESTKKDIVSIFKIPPEKIAVIYPGINHDIFNITRDERKEEGLRSKYNIKKEYILYLGTIEPRKNVLSLIVAYEKFHKATDNIDLILAGNLGWLYNEVLNKINWSIYKKDIKLLTTVTEEEKPSLYRMARLFVFPSLYEGFGFPPLEAMACGVPTITSMASSLPEILGDASVYVNPYNVSQLTLAIDNLIADKNFCAKIVASGIKQVQKYSWDKTAKETLELIHSSICI